MNEQTFCLYGLAAAFLVWGALGLRFALSVLVANIVLAFILFFLGPALGDNNLLHVLMLLYPLYWGLAFAAFRFLDRPDMPSISVPLRFGLGCVTALGLVMWAHWGFLAREGNLFRITYLVEPRERAAHLADFLKSSDRERVCGDSYTTLMQLAAKAGDKEVVGVLFSAFSACNGAAETVSDTVKPLIDNGDAASLEFLLRNGLEPDTEVFGHDYANGTALAYAAVIAKQPGRVRRIAASAPAKARAQK